MTPVEPEPETAFKYPQDSAARAALAPSPRVSPVTKHDVPIAPASVGDLPETREYTAETLEDERRSRGLPTFEDNAANTVSTAHITYEANISRFDDLTYMQRSPGRGLSSDMTGFAGNNATILNEVMKLRKRLRALLALPKRAASLTVAFAMRPAGLWVSYINSSHGVRDTKNVYIKHTNVIVNVTGVAILSAGEPFSRTQRCGQFTDDRFVFYLERGCPMEFGLTVTISYCCLCQRYPDFLDSNLDTARRNRCRSVHQLVEDQDGVYL